jgi:hypothetical protein
MKYIGLLSSAASGKLAGIVASHNRGGTYFRHHAIPTQPRTAAQKLVRNQLQAFSGAFKSLTASQVQGWNALGATVSLKSKLGTTYHPTGQQLFVSCNKHLANVAITVQLSNAPSIPSIPGITTFTATPVGSGSTVTSWGLATTPNLASNFAVQVRASAVQSGGRTFIGKSAFRNIYGVNPAPTQVVNATVFSAYVTRFGPLPATGIVGFLLRYVDPISGFAGTPVSCTATFTQSSAGVSLVYAAPTPGGTWAHAAVAGTLTWAAPTVTPGGFNGAVNYSITGEPAGMTYSFTANPLTAASGPVAQISGNVTGGAGVYPLTLNATYGTYNTSLGFNVTLT